MLDGDVWWARRCHRMLGAADVTVRGQRVSVQNIYDYVTPAASSIRSLSLDRERELRLQLQPPGGKNK